MIIETEEELLHAIKQWLKKHGISILIGATTLLAIGGGWYAAKRQNENNLAQASILYEDLQESFKKEDKITIQNLSKKLTENYKQTPYAKLTALLMAKQFATEGKLDLAKEQLTWVIEKAEVPPIRQIARLRLARILLAENDKKEALSTLESIDDATFQPLIEQLKGDIQEASGDHKAAKDAYEKALKSWPSNIPGKDAIESKIRGSR